VSDRIFAKQWFLRIQRRLIKYQLAKSDPAALVRRGLHWLLPTFRRAAKHSPAYRTLLAEAGVDPATIKTPADFIARCPVLDKSNTFKRFGVDQLLCDDVPITSLASVLTSSGHGAGGFALGLSTRKQFRHAPQLIDLGLEMAFAIDRRRTLLINCLPMGVTFSSDAVCVANVSVREDMACAIVQQAGNLFEQIILCGDPLFLKKLCDYSQTIGLDWGRHRIHVIVGEETFPETFRDYLAGVLGIRPDDPASGLIGSSMGVGELGLNLFNETRETVALRRACISNPALLENLTGIDGAVSPAPTFMVFNPLRTFVEVINPDAHGVGDLVVSVMDKAAPVPLMRYCTGDRMQFISTTALREAVAEVPGGLALPSLPLIALHGRTSDRLPGGGHVDLFKAALYQQPTVTRHLTGAHRISLEGETIRWEVQAARDSQENIFSLSGKLQTVLTSCLRGRRINVQVIGYDSFPHGMNIDYERKFNYWGASKPRL
jgi:phenylacetate-CoA ligase